MDGIISLISPTLTILGWGIAFQMAKMNSTRTESKSIMDACNQVIDSLSEKGASFYLDKPVDTFEKRAFEHLSNIKIATIYKKIEHLNQRGINISDEMISDFHVALTRNIHDQGTDKSRPDTYVHNIFRASSDITTTLMLNFQKKYPPFNGIRSFKQLFNFS